MRYCRVAAIGSLLLAAQTILACDDSEDRASDRGEAGTSSGATSNGGSGASPGAGSGAAPTEAGAGGSAQTGGTPSTGGAAAGSGGAAGAGGTAGLAGAAGTGGAPMCTTDAQCADVNPCTDDLCVEGKCLHAINTATCDDGNECTSGDVCSMGACVGSNNSLACDDLSSCTSTDHCNGGVCGGTKNFALCPSCEDATNIIQNCDFSSGMEHWLEGFFEGGGGTTKVTNERLVVDISAGGSAIFSVQPRQEPLLIRQGFRYVLRMVAGASVDRNIVIALTQAAAPYQVYSTGDNPGGGFTLALTEQMKPFEFDFLMTKPDDANVKLELKLGGAAGNPSVVYMDDIAVLEQKCTGPADCSDGNECTTDACDTATGKCSSTNNTATCATDNNACTSDVCVAGECTHAALADGDACTDDANACTEDACLAGACAHDWDLNVCACQQDIHCDDHDVCTDDTCTTGVCGYVDNTAPCDDGNVCTVQDACAAGSCAPGTFVCFDCTTGGNLLTNCNFTTDATGWLEGFFNGGAGTQVAQNGMLAVTITNPGTEAYMVQPRQEGLELVQGTTYVVRFNAMATVARPMVVSLTQNGGAYQSYSGEKTLNLTTTMQRLEFEFTMGAAPPTEKVKFEIRLGGTGNNPTVPNTVYLDNMFIAPKP